MFKEIFKINNKKIKNGIVGTGFVNFLYQYCASASSHQDKYIINKKH